MRIIILEDDANRMVEFNERINELKIMSGDIIELVHVDTAEECISKLEEAYYIKERFDGIFLDHDLGGDVNVDVKNKNTGSEVARWISENKIKIMGSQVLTHTLNPAGAENIKSLVSGCEHFPFLWMKSRFHNIIKIK